LRKGLSTPLASDGVIPEVEDKGDPARAGFPFNGQTNHFDISINYFDENDGRSQMTLRVDSWEIASWTRDSDLGASIANAQTLTSKTFTGIELTADSLVELMGRADGGEPPRVDSVVLERSDKDLSGGFPIRHDTKIRSSILDPLRKAK
jgi:hypothetical protein